MTFPACRRSDDGFILPTTLFVLAAILIAAAWYGTWTSKMLGTASSQLDAVHFHQDSQSTFSLVMHRIALSQSSPRGVYLAKQETSSLMASMEEVTAVGPELIFDDRCYVGVGDIRFSIQDENGLIGVNFFQREQLGTLLSLMGVALDRQGPLIDKLEDYLDPDQLLRLNGAEEKEYRRAKKEGPANALLLNAAELYNVLGWDGLNRLWQETDFRRLVTLATIGVPNLNTAPKQALLTVPTINEELATAIIDKRQLRGHESLSSLEAAIGQSLGFDPLGLGFYPGSYLRISIWHENMNLLREVHIQLTPIAEHRQPWYIDYEITVPLPAEQKLKACETITEIFPHSAVPAD